MDQSDKVRLIAELRNNYRLFAAHNLIILDKGAQRTALTFNRAQAYVHMKLEEQRARLGRVRALILKGRQQGISTFIGGRFYHRTSMVPGLKALIIAHEAKATDNLFKMVKRYLENNPMAPSTMSTNSKELLFGALDSGYGVATAGAKDTGRSLTAQLFHGSEFAFWDNAQSHMAGIGNAVGDVDGTEIILESTGNGIGNAFHLMWQLAEAGIGEYIPIFVPWYWQDEYCAKEIPDRFELSREDLEYKTAYGLSDLQMVWRANKIATYGEGHAWRFDQEYPATPVLAFQSPTANPLISPSMVARAMNNQFRERYGAFYIGCDPAEYGDDRTAIVFRHGRVVFRIETYEKKGPMEVAGMLARYWLDFKPDALVVDRIGIGSGIVDRLKEQNIPVIGINSAQRADDAQTYANKRAEMWWVMRDWIDDYPARLPNDMALASDLSAPGFKHTSNGLKLLESKDDMRARGIRSPDIGDALALTFAVAVAPQGDGEGRSVGSSGATAATSAGY